MRPRYRPPPPPRVPAWRLATAASTPLGGLLITWYSLVVSDVLLIAVGVLTVALGSWEVRLGFSQHREYEQYCEKYPSHRP